MAFSGSFSIARGKSNTLDVTLDGVPARIFLAGFPSASAGTGFLSKTFTVTAADADGHIIVGTYATPITLTDGDTSGATAIATSGSDNPPAGELLGSSDGAAISYTGQAIAPATIGAVSGAARGSGIFAVHLPLYVADTNNNKVKEIPIGCSTSSCVVTLGAGFSSPTGVAVDASANVYVGDFGNNSVKKIPPGCASSGCVTALGGGFGNPAGVAVGATGIVYVADTGFNAVKEIPLNCVSASCVITIGGGFDAPSGVVADGFGDVFVADTLHSAVKEIPAGCTSSGCVVTLGGGFNQPTAVSNL